MMTKVNTILLTILLLLVLRINGQEVKTIDFEALQATKPWEKTEVWEPVPPKVVPGIWSLPPSDAIVLFGGENLAAWHKPKYDYGVDMEQVEQIIRAKTKSTDFTEAEWEVKDGAMIVRPGGGALETKRAFGDVQLHLEWLSPADPGKEGQAYSNSGVFLMGLYEVQVLNSYANETYPNGQAGAVYKQHIPLVNASRPPGEWQSYDIVFKAPRFDFDGSLLSPAFLTVFHNGVLIQNHAELKGPAIYIGEPHYTPHPEKMPLLLQDHGDKVRFRNIWIREL